MAGKPDIPKDLSDPSKTISPKEGQPTSKDNPKNEPSEPTQPSTKPEKPDEGGKPQNPDKPQKSVKPQKPAKPQKPVKEAKKPGASSEKRDEPQKPVEPQNPVEPGKGAGKPGKSSEERGEPEKPVELDKKAEKPAEPQKPAKPQEPPGKIMSMMMLPVPFSRGGCCGDTLPFFMSCIVLSVLGIVPSFANLALITAYLFTYSKQMYDPIVGTCVNAWWEDNNPLFLLFSLPFMLLLLHMTMLVVYIIFCTLLIVATLLRSASLLRINSFIGFCLVLPTFSLGIVEVFYVSNDDTIHWNAVFIFFFTAIFLYSTMIVHGYAKRLMDPPKEKVDYVV